MTLITVESIHVKELPILSIVSSKQFNFKKRCKNQILKNKIAVGR